MGRRVWLWPAWSLWLQWVAGRWLRYGLDHDGARLWPRDWRRAYP